MQWVIEIIVNIMEKKAAEKAYAKIFLQLYKKYEQYKKLKSLYAAIKDPKQWLRLLSKATKKELETIAKVTKELDKYTETKSYYKLDKGEYDKKNQELTNELEGKGNWVKLSSSWLEAGIWEQTNRNKVMGSLTIKIQNYPKQYTYPIVPYQVWVAMKNASGRNGTGAGSAFWKFWLREWLPSNLRAKVLKDLASGEITSNDAREVFKNITSKSATGFYRSNGKKNTQGSLNKAWYATYGGKGYRTNLIKNYKKYNYYNSRIITYKNFNRTKFAGYKIEPITKTVVKPTKYAQVAKDILRFKSKKKNKTKF